MSASPRASHGILSLTIKSKEDLYRSYMPFIKNGGLFVPTPRDYQLGEEVFMLLDLMEEPDKLPVSGKVIWVTPRGAQGGKQAGIGIQLSADDNTLLGKIETYLAGALGSGRLTHTM
ncbi:pilus assembly protein PilZ [Motiliproteus coralliicola]|uniref:Pilus assembly protein PilZ n=1 Tax=Motiliproteus coralliicola TaxID=2283196 RepID=A0A369WVY8_9GAMM|nr:PilZ domain-containing protein [Motiliproteus coralliicola]RDE24714.1 pilus assembly protein PilZ [Motiliproteus coralliicola]